MEYFLRAYSHMIADEVRMHAFERALAQAVRPGSVVADIGAGTGAISLAAARLGARKVYAIERDDVIEVARQIVGRNGLDERISCIQAPSGEVELPEPADVIVSDLRGVLPLYDGHITAVVDARSRFLASGGVQIAARDRLCAALAESSEEYSKNISVWEQDDFDLATARDLAVNSWWRVRFKGHELLSAPQTIGVIDYTTVTDPRFRGEAVFETRRTGTAHGVCVWSEMELAPEIGLSNAPGQPELIYGQAFFPLSRPLPLMSGDTVSFKLDATLVDDEYAFSWTTSASPSKGTPAAFTQSTVLGAVITPRRLQSSRSDFTPSLGPRGQAARRALELMDGGTTTGTIADTLVAENSELFPTRTDALRLVVEIVRCYG